MPLQKNLVTWGVPFLIATSYGFLALLPDLRLAIPELLGATALITVLLAWACRAGEGGLVKWSPAIILLPALLFRLFFVLRPPELSDDIFRYLWDGLHTLQGVNPYVAAPDRVLPASDALRQLASRVNHPSLVTVYPPAAQAVFAAGASLGGKVLGLKGLLVALDLASCALILRLLAARGRNLAWGALYAWHPLPVLEIAGSGHIDGAGVFFLLLALTLLAAPPRRLSSRPGLASLAAGASFAGAILSKLFPLVFLPAALLFAGKKDRASFLLGLFAAGGLLCLPFWPEMLNALGTLEAYARHWEFSGFVYRTLSALSGSGLVARLIIALLFGGVWFLAHGRLRKRPAEARAPFKTLYAVTLAFLLLTPTLHPWYALYLAALLPFAAEPAGIILSWAVLLAYRVLAPYAILGEWIESDLWALLIFAAPVVALALRRGNRRKNHQGQTP
ncbi:hypothetical protein [Desulfuromonas sp.]|uniref:hypothetical protein n=1 Tax=Desulfuromonas sp. TaxID=892 RepID=UPI0025BF9A6C|nr:hypothetical protein [Desulfuromonas sp.]